MFLWMRFFMEVPMKPSALLPFKFLKSLATPHLYGVLVHVTGNNLSLVPLSPEINLSPASTTPAITENP
jgi:hypothetical protein